MVAEHLVDGAKTLSCVPLVVEGHDLGVEGRRLDSRSRARTEELGSATGQAAKGTQVPEVVPQPGAEASGLPAGIAG